MSWFQFHNYVDDDNGNETEVKIMKDDDDDDISDERSDKDRPG